MTNQANNLPEVHIEASDSWRLPDLKELFDYRELLFLTVLRNIKITYAQSVGSYAWTVFLPFLQIIVFSIIFGGLLGMEGNDGTPYPVFVTVSLVAWNYIQKSSTDASAILVHNSHALAKVYVPRLLWILTPVCTNLVPFAISLLLVTAALLIYQVPLTLNILFLPGIVLLMMVLPITFGLIFSTLAIRYRDFNYAVGYIFRMMIFMVPVAYSSNEIPEDLRIYYILNPFVGVIEAFNACILGGDFRMDSLIMSIVISLIFLFGGAVYFQRMERVIVDVI